VFHEFLRFALVGSLATCVHYAILISLMERAHSPLVLSTSIGFVFGSLLSYTLNRRITFNHQPHFGRGLAKYVAVGTVGLGLNALIVAGLAYAGAPYMLAQVAASGVVLVWNFGAARIMVFRPQVRVG
jgi:putative flippase GtrA